MAQKKPDTSLYIPSPYTKTPSGLWLCPEFHILKGRSKILYMMMLSKMDVFRPEKEFAFTYEEIQSITKWNKNSISASIKELIKDGWIIRTQGGRFPHNVSLYRIDLKPLQRKYPKIRRALPDYLKDSIVVDGNM